MKMELSSSSSSSERFVTVRSNDGREFVIEEKLAMFVFKKKIEDGTITLPIRHESKMESPSLSSSKKIVRIRSSDGQVFEVEEKVAMMSGLIKEMIEKGYSDDRDYYDDR